MPMKSSFGTACGPIGRVGWVFLMFVNSFSFIKAGPWTPLDPCGPVFHQCWTVAHLWIICGPVMDHLGISMDHW